MHSYTLHGYGFYLVKHTEQNLAMGICGLVKRDQLADIDIGYAFLPEFTGHGYALEAASAVLEYAMTTLQFQKVVAITTPDNARSIQLLEKMGLQYEGNVQIAGDKETLHLFGTA